MDSNIVKKGADLLAGGQMDGRQIGIRSTGKVSILRWNGLILDKIPLVNHAETMHNCKILTQARDFSGMVDSSGGGRSVIHVEEGRRPDEANPHRFQ